MAEFPSAVQTFRVEAARVRLGRHRPPGVSGVDERDLDEFGGKGGAERAPAQSREHRHQAKTKLHAARLSRNEDGIPLTQARNGFMTERVGPIDEKIPRSARRRAEDRAACKRATYASRVRHVGMMSKLPSLA